jgi:hypothetical protein
MELDKPSIEKNSCYQYLKLTVHCYFVAQLAEFDSIYTVETTKKNRFYFHLRYFFKVVKWTYFIENRFLITNLYFWTIL